MPVDIKAYLQQKGLLPADSTIQPTTPEEMQRYGIKTPEEMELAKQQRAQESAQLAEMGNDAAVAQMLRSSLDKVGTNAGQILTKTTPDSTASRQALANTVQAQQGAFKTDQDFQRKLEDDQFDRLGRLDSDRLRLAEAENARRDRQAMMLLQKEANEIARNQTREDKLNMHREKIDERRKHEAKLSDKQTQDVTDFDSTIETARDIERQLKGNWVGPVDGRVPDLAVGGDQAAFRASVGRMVDSYRKMITGAAAGDRELAKIESRLPRVTDTPEQFKAKAQSFAKEMEKAKIRYLRNLKRKGKDTTEFEVSEGPQQTSSSDDREALDWAMKNQGDPRATEILLHLNKRSK